MNGKRIQTDLRWLADDARRRLQRTLPPQASELLERSEQRTVQPRAGVYLGRVAAAILVIGVAMLLFLPLNGVPSVAEDVPEEITALVESLYGDSAEGSYVAGAISPLLPTGPDDSDDFMLGVWNSIGGTQ
jgi:hypothetical protein